MKKPILVLALILLISFTSAQLSIYGTSNSKTINLETPAVSSSSSSSSGNPFNQDLNTTNNVRFVNGNFDYVNITNTGEQLRLNYNASSYVRFVAEDDGDINFISSLTGGAIKFTSWLIVNAGALTVNADSNRVGIGMTTPQVNLHVNSSTGDYPARFESSDTYSIIQMKDNQASAYAGIHGSQGKAFFGTASALNQNNIVLNLTGGAGIRTINPLATFHVNGTIRADNGFNMNGTQGITSNLSVGPCWIKFTGGIATSSNCTAL